MEFKPNKKKILISIIGMLIINFLAYLLDLLYSSQGFEFFIKAFSIRNIIVTFIIFYAVTSLSEKKK